MDDREEVGKEEWRRKIRATMEQANTAFVVVAGRRTEDALVSMVLDATGQ
jgi:hypothetical protein